MANYKIMKKAWIDDLFNQAESLLDHFLKLLEVENVTIYYEDSYICVYKHFKDYLDEPFDNDEQCRQYIQILYDVIKDCGLKPELLSMLLCFKSKFESISNDYKRLEEEN